MYHAVYVSSICIHTNSLNAHMTCHGPNLYTYTHFQGLVEDLAEKITSLEEDQKLFNDCMQDLDQLYQDMFTTAIETHGAKVFSDLNALLNVSPLSAFQNHANV